MQAILDNYSRSVVSFNFSKKICAQNTVDLINRAIKTHGPPKGLMNDAGKENLNKLVKGHLANFNIKHRVSRMNTRYSNSKIEVLFRMLKSNYLNHLKITNRKELMTRINFYINSYNFEIPHSALNFRTPDEAFREVKVDHYEKLFSEYRKTTIAKRLEEYKKKAPFGA